MNIRYYRLPLGLALFGLAFFSVNAAPLRVLYFSKSSGWEHSVVKRVDGKPSYSENVLSSLAAKNDLAFTFSKDGSLFSPDYLAQFDVILFYTSGDLCSGGTDGQPAMTGTGKQALLDAVAGGKGFVALHCASDTFHTFGSAADKPAEPDTRYRNHGDAADPYIKMLGGEFIDHDEQQMAKVQVADAGFPGCAELGDAFELHEEWYSLKEFAPDLHVLLVLETTGMKGSNYERPSYPLAWARAYGKGRVWFNAMGHREDVWDNPKFQAMLIGGIEWAAGRKPAEIVPNLKKVAPAADVLPSFRPGT